MQSSWPVNWSPGLGLCWWETQAQVRGGGIEGGREVSEGGRGGRRGGQSIRVQG